MREPVNDTQSEWPTCPECTNKILTVNGRDYFCPSKRCKLNKGISPEKYYLKYTGARYLREIQQLLKAIKNDKRTTSKA